MNRISFKLALIMALLVLRPGAEAQVVLPEHPTDGALDLRSEFKSSFIQMKSGGWTDILFSVRGLEKLTPTAAIQSETAGANCSIAFLGLESNGDEAAASAGQSVTYKIRIRGMAGAESSSCTVQILNPSLNRTADIVLYF